MQAEYPAETCPKCGNREGWKGPRYQSQANGEVQAAYRLREWLAWTCMVCGYDIRKPTIDQQPGSAG